MTTLEHSDYTGHHQNLIRMQQPETAKNVHVFLNGDTFFAGRKFVINRKHTANFDGFLTQVTLGMKAPFGAIRNVYTPQHGHRVNELEQLKNGMQLVAGGVERFRKFQYNEIAKRKHPKPKRNYLDIKLRSTRINVSARWRKYVKDPCQIYVYGNGDINAPAIRMLLIPRLMQTWDLVLREITEKISLRTGQAVRKNRQPLPPIKKSANSTAQRESYTKMFAQKKKQKEKGEETTVMKASAATGNRPLKMKAHQPQKPRGPPTHEGESVFHAKPVKVKRASGREAATSDVYPPLEENDGVFRVNPSHIKADEVAEDENTKLELPIDQLPAGEVEEEHLPPDQKTLDEEFSERQKLTVSESEDLEPDLPLSEAALVKDSAVVDQHLHSKEDAGAKELVKSDEEEASTENEALNAPESNQNNYTHSTVSKGPVLQKVSEKEGSDIATKILLTNLNESPATKEFLLVEDTQAVNQEEKSNALKAKSKNDAKVVSNEHYALVGEQSNAMDKMLDSEQRDTGKVSAQLDKQVEGKEQYENSSETNSQEEILQHQSPGTSFLQQPNEEGTLLQDTSQFETENDNILEEDDAAKFESDNSGDMTRSPDDANGDTFTISEPTEEQSNANSLTVIL